MTAPGLRTLRTVVATWWIHGPKNW